jgi:hypothetical protein
MRVILDRNAVLATRIKTGRTGPLLRESVLCMSVRDHHNERTDKREQKNSHNYPLLREHPSKPKRQERHPQYRKNQPRAPELSTRSDKLAEGCSFLTGSKKQQL